MIEKKKGGIAYAIHGYNVNRFWLNDIIQMSK